VVEAHRDELADLCREWGVRRLEVFGSAAGDSFGDSSDVDLLVVFDWTRPGSPLKRYFGFEDSVADLLGRDADLVDPDVIRNRWFKVSVDQTRKLLYAAEGD
jgi:predicted nucleotidyltransferase